jgi:hypothetical protein
MKNILLIAVFFSQALPRLEASPLQSYRAVYDMSLDPHAQGFASVQDLTGSLSVEFRRMCEGWMMQQHSLTETHLPDGSKEMTKWGYVVLESLDGKTLHFNSYRNVNGKQVEHVKGKASLATMTVDFELPQARSIKLAEGTIFPIEHLNALLKAAQKGETTHPALVFDGSQDQGPLEISAFIGKSQKSTHQKMVDLNQFPMSLAIYQPDPVASTPEYETQQQMLSNGVLSSFVLDYSHFKIKGNLDEIEFFPAEMCAAR